MDTYSILRQFADSWVLLAMFSFFIGVAVYAFWPSMSEDRKQASMIPFRNDKPAGSAGADGTGDGSKLSQQPEDMTDA